MTLDEIRSSKKEFLVPSDVAPVIGCDPYSINVQAREDIRALGFPCCRIGSRVKIPRIGFLRWMEGNNDKEG